MAQGIFKSKPAKATTTSSRRPNVLGPKKGARTIVPRKPGLVRQNKLTKKYSAGLTASTERTLGARVGHLELLGGGKGKKTRNQKENPGKKLTQSKDATKNS
ncbi:BgTH12-00401 [Blumeria graminis f. sp. triticale]|uniref:Bgt-4115 n=3 Tax=Blumeria graminis TaxID=34373 RepID=A0A061HIN7_BLUGR|nr:hypothetical protein BGT96224_4115 [Blumeria graminis f. sp. tritici 96224]CAD6504900.1 BgTH12-00401 [Blumeria graminis f. sp. triticale]VDB92918.1 Bgt-4115 [Blumeria graminis f. sp. tritici]